MARAWFHLPTQTELVNPIPCHLVYERNIPRIWREGAKTHKQKKEKKEKRTEEAENGGGSKERFSTMDSVTATGFPHETEHLNPRFEIHAGKGSACLEPPHGHLSRGASRADTLSQSSALEVGRGS